MGHDMDGIRPDQRKWHVSKEIPLALLISIASSLFLGGVAYQSLKSDIIVLQNTQKEIRDENKETTSEVRTLANRMQEGSVPSAQNSWRITQLEALTAKQDARLADIERQGQIRESRVLRLENAVGSTSARLRAQSER